MSERTLEAAAVPEYPRPEPPTPPRNRLALDLARQYVWWLVGAFVVVFSTALVLWSRTRPGYDPYGWLIWGYQTLHLNLDLGGAPSWKPLTWVFDVPFSLFGAHAMRLWMITAVSVSLSAGVFAARIAYRVTFQGEQDRYPAVAAAVFAGLAVLGIQDYMHYILSAQSDPMIVAFCLAAIDAHLSGHHRWAFALGVLASLGRPEVWPFLGLYVIWAWRAKPAMRWMIVAGLAVIPLLWFGIPTITNGRPFVSAQLALRSPRELHQNKITGVINRFTALTYLPVQLAALAAIGLAWMRRNWTVLAIAGGAVGWVIVEIAFALHGWAAVPRYLFEAGALTSLLAGIGVGLMLSEATRIGHRVPRWAAVAIAGVLVISLVPGALARYHKERTDLKHERDRTAVINRLQATINHLGGYQHIRACGEPVSIVEYVSILAYFTKLNDGKVGHRPNFELRQKYPIVMIQPLHSGWKVFPWHTAPKMVAACANLNASWIYTSHHPDGVLVNN